MLKRDEVSCGKTLLEIHCLGSWRGQEGDIEGGAAAGGVQRRPPEAVRRVQRPPRGQQGRPHGRPGRARVSL